MHDSSIKNILAPNPVWYWFDKDHYDIGDNNGWIKVSTVNNAMIEKEYRKVLKRKRNDQKNNDDHINPVIFHTIFQIEKLYIIVLVI